MPTRVNGIGTGYYGTSNLQAFDGVCEHCHRAAKLRNYETRLWFSVFFIPVIPLGRKQILSQCPICTWHRAVPFGEWERVRQEAIGESASKWDGNRDDPDAALEMHSTLVAFQKRDDAERLATLLLERFADVSRVQFYFGAWYERIGKGTDADACFARALQLDPTSLPAKRAVAIGHIEKGRLPEARALLTDFEPPKEAFEPSLFFMLARAHQRQEQHEQALEMYRMLMRYSPGIAAQKDFRSAVRRSEKALGLETSLVRTDPFYRSTAFKWAVAALLLVTGIAGWNLFVMTHRALHILNGLNVPIAVQVDGSAPVEIPAGGRQELTVAEGSHRASVIQPQGFTQPVEFAVRAGWFDRFFKSPVYVIDPSRSAALIWESAVYRERPANVPAGSDSTMRWHLGEPFTTYADIDYPFQEFPAELRLDNKSSEVTKTRLMVVGAGPAEIVGVLSREPGHQADLLSFAESHLRVAPANKILLAVYYALATQLQQVDRCRDFLATRLDDRPVLIDWHRAYQEIRQTDGRRDDLPELYDRYLAADPGNSALLYLRGRLETDDARAAEYFGRARVADPKNPYPWFAEGYQLLVSGDFAGARQAIEEACRLDPDDLRMSQVLYDVQFANADYGTLEHRFREQLEKTPLNIVAQKQLLETLCAAGKDDQAGTVHEAYAQKAREFASDKFQLGLQSQLQLHYLRGRFDEFQAAARQLHDAREAAEAQFAAALELGAIENVAPPPNALRALERGRWELLLSLAWSGMSDADRSAAARDRAIAVLSSGGRSEREAAEYLKQGTPLAAGTAEKLSLEPETKAVLLVALAELCPGEKAGLLALAEKLNYRRSFPHRFLSRRIAALRGE
jgi:Flp pilus assembly protein TadD